MREVSRKEKIQLYTYGEGVCLKICKICVGFTEWSINDVLQALYFLQMQSFLPENFYETGCIGNMQIIHLLVINPAKINSLSYLLLCFGATLAVLRVLVLA